MVRDNGDSKILRTVYDNDSLESALVRFGVSEGASRKLAQLGRFSLHLHPAKEGAEGARPFTKVGGHPDLPQGLDWPTRPSWPRATNSLQGDISTAYFESPQPYSFIAQISFKELIGAGLTDAGLPEGGALYLFYDAVAQRWGYDPNDAVGFKVIFVPDIEETQTVEKATFGLGAPIYGELFLNASPRFEWGGDEGLHYDGLSLSEADREVYSEFLDATQDQPDVDWRSASNHKVLGWPNAIQGPMEEQCALVTSGINCGGPEGYSSPDALRVMAMPNEWMLLLEIGSDDDAGMMWGDWGRLFLWIKASDLERRDFDNTWLILQCS